MSHSNISRRSFVWEAGVAENWRERDFDEGQDEGREETEEEDDEEVR